MTTARPPESTRLARRSLLLIFWFGMSGSPLRAAVEDCPCEEMSSEEQVERASAIFIGRLLEIKVETHTGTRTLVFDPMDQFKGEERDEFRIRDVHQGTRCELVVQEGAYFLVYAHWQWGAWITSSCWGTKLTKTASAKETELLGLPNAAKEQIYDKLRTYCMGTYKTSCCLASVTAMREGRFLPEPEGGCPAGSRPDQLKCLGGHRWCVPASAPLPTR